MLLYFSVCRLSDLSELVKYCPHPVSVDRFYTEPRNITSLAERRLSGSAHQLSIPVGGAAVTARVVAWKMDREEINKKCSWKYFRALFWTFQRFFSFSATFPSNKIQKSLLIILYSCSSLVWINRTVIGLYVILPEYELCFCMWRILLVTPLTNDTWHVCWETSQNSSHVKNESEMWM